MRSSLIKSCLLALASASTALAQVAGFDVFTAPDPQDPGASIKAGSTYTIKWIPSSPAGKISIALLEGNSNTTLQVGPSVATSIDSTLGSYAWKVPTNIPAFTFFGFKLSLDSDTTTFQYSTYFSISGLAASASSGSNTGSTTTVASTTVTQKVSQVGPVTSASTTTLSASLVPVNSTSATSTKAGTFHNSTTITSSTTSVVATSSSSSSGSESTPSTSSSAPPTTSSSGAVSNIAAHGTGLLGAFFVAFGMLL